jgi:hypothetical protein
MEKKLMKANPETRQAEGKNKGAKSAITSPLKQTLSVSATPEVRNTAGFDTVTMVDRTRPEGSPEAARIRNNQSRDRRTVLGRSTWSVPVLDSK